MRLIARWIISALFLILIGHLIPGIEVSGFYIALIAALLLGLVNALVRPLLIFITLPINILTLGLFTLVINGLLFWFVASFVEGFAVAGFWSAFLGALIFSLLSSITSAAIG
jgi:putative membrane protein